MSLGKAVVAIIVCIGGLALGESFAPIRRRLDRIRRRRAEEQVPNQLPRRDLADVYGDVVHTPQSYDHLPRLPLNKRL